MNTKSFTLLELIIVIIIIGVLSSLALPKLMISIYCAELAEVHSTFGSLRRAMDTCFLMHSCEEGCAMGPNICTFDTLTIDNPNNNPQSKFYYRLWYDNPEPDYTLIATPLEGGGGPHSVGDRDGDGIKDEIACFYRHHNPVMNNKCHVAGLYQKCPIANKFDI